MCVVVVGEHEMDGIPIDFDYYYLIIDYLGRQSSIVFNVFLSSVAESI